MKIGDDLFYELIPWNFIICFPLYTHPKGNRSTRSRVKRRNVRPVGVGDGDNTSIVVESRRQRTPSSSPEVPPEPAVSYQVPPEPAVGDDNMEFKGEDETSRGEEYGSGMEPKDANYRTDENTDDNYTDENSKLSPGLFLLSNVVIDYYEELARAMPYKKMKYVIAGMEEELDVGQKSAAPEDLVGGSSDGYSQEAFGVGLEKQDANQEAAAQEQMDFPRMIDLNEEPDWVEYCEQREERGVESKQVYLNALDEYHEDMMKEHDNAENVILLDKCLENGGEEGEGEVNVEAETVGEQQTNEAVLSEITSNIGAVEIACTNNNTAKVADTVDIDTTVIPTERGFPPCRKMLAVDLYSAVKQRRNRGVSRCIVMHKNGLPCEEPNVAGHFHCQRHLERKPKIIRQHRKEGPEADGQSSNDSSSSSKPPTAVVTRIYCDERSGRKKKTRAIKSIYEAIDDATLPPTERPSTSKT